MLIASFRRDLINAELDIFISHLKTFTIRIEGQNTAGGKANMLFRPSFCVVFSDNCHFAQLFRTVRRYSKSQHWNKTNTARKNIV